MRFFDAERKKNDEFRRNKQKQDLPWIETYEGQIGGKKNACNKSVNYMAVVFSLFPNGIQHKKSYERDRNSIDEKKPPVCLKKPSDYIDEKCKSPDSEKNERCYNFAVEIPFRFFKAFRFFPTVMGIQKIIDGDAENFAHFFKNVSIGNSLGPFPFGNTFVGIVKKFAEFRLGHSFCGAKVYNIACGYNFKVFHPAVHLLSIFILYNKFLNISIILKK